MDRSFATMMIPVLSFLPVTIYTGWFTLVAMCCESAAVRVFLEMQTTADSQMYSVRTKKFIACVFYKTTRYLLGELCLVCLKQDKLNLVLFYDKNRFSIDIYGFSLILF